MRVAVTGGTGSLGRALIAKLVEGGADRIVTCSRDEQKRASLAGDQPSVRVLAGDVRDESRLVQVFRGCEVVIHAAARKVVNAHPDEPEEMLKTNVMGTHHVINAALACGVGKVLVISSDKAVRAENVYGVTKALAEHLAVAANARTFPAGTRVSVIRYGNVIGSNGSVVRVWRESLRRDPKASLVVTDAAMTRFWLTLPQAVDFVLAAIAQMRGGETFVPHLPAAPLARLAEAVSREQLGDDPRDYVVKGIRAGGEKLHEEMLSAAEVRRTLRRGEFYVVPPFIHDEMWDARPWLGTHVPPELVYRSDVWPWQLTVDEMRGLLDGV